MESSLEDFPGVLQAFQGLLVEERSFQELLQSVFEGPQRTKKIAAIDRRDLAGFERRERLYVIPVEKMTFMPLQPVEGGHGVGQVLDDLVQREIPEVMGRDCAEHPKADIGGAGAHPQLIPMRDLVVIGGKPGSLFADEVRKITPRLPCDLPEKPPSLVGQNGELPLCARPAGEGPAPEWG